MSKAPIKLDELLMDKRMVLQLILKGALLTAIGQLTVKEQIC